MPKQARRADSESTVTGHPSECFAETPRTCTISSSLYKKKRCFPHLRDKRLFYSNDSIGWNALKPSVRFNWGKTRRKAFPRQDATQKITADGL